MKTILLLRHGHSEADDRLPDAERPLSAQGRRDAGRMGRLLGRAGLRLALVVCSPARRALQTATLAAAGGGYTGKLRTEPRLYEAEEGGYLEVLRGLPARAQAVLLVGHNPAIRQAAAALLGCPPGALRFAPAAVACLEAPVAAWSSLQAGSCALRWLVPPEMAGAFR